MSRDAWPTSIIVLAASVIGILAVFRETTWSVLLMWRTTTYSHGFLILPICFYLVWTGRRRIGAVQPVPNPWALGLLAPLGLAWLLADLGAVPVAKQVALVGMLPAMVWVLLGTCVTRRMMFPLAFLFFAVPIGETLVPPLQGFTAFFAVKLPDLAGVPVVLEGRIISVPSGTWEVAQACTGLRYLISSVALGCLYSYLVYAGWGRRLGFLLASIVTPILANGVRVFGIILSGHLASQRLAVRGDHLVSGWTFFALVMFLLFTLGWRWREPITLHSLEHVPRLVDCGGSRLETRYATCSC